MKKYSYNCSYSPANVHIYSYAGARIRMYINMLIGQVNANFLQNVQPQLMENVPLHLRINMWMQYDGASPHYALCSRQVMNEFFDEKWIGRGGPVAWPPRSPDLTSPDYFFMEFCQRTRNGGSTYDA